MCPETSQNRGSYDGTKKVVFCVLHLHYVTFLCFFFCSAPNILGAKQSKSRNGFSHIGSKEKNSIYVSKQSIFSYLCYILKYFFNDDRSSIWVLILITFWTYLTRSSVWKTLQEDARSNQINLYQPIKQSCLYFGSVNSKRKWRGKINQSKCRISKMFWAPHSSGGVKFTFFILWMFEWAKLFNYRIRTTF